MKYIYIQERRQIVKIKHYMQVIARITLDTCKSHFRLSRTSFKVFYYSTVFHANQILLAIFLFIEIAFYFTFLFIIYLLYIYYKFIYYIFFCET